MKEIAQPSTKGARINIKIVNIKNNTALTVKGYKAASDITDVGISTIKTIINCENKSSKGYRFYNLN